MVVMMKKIRKVKYHISSKKSIKARIVQISDLHYYQEKDIILLNRIENEIKGLNPDYICITGDLIDETEIDATKLIEWIKDLKEISPIIISLGNHDTKDSSLLKETNSEEIFQSLSKIEDIYVLDNNQKKIGQFCFIGVTVSDEVCFEDKKSNSLFIKNLKKIPFKELNSNKYNIVLCHTPYVVIDKRVWKRELFKNSDLILCGHTHGGIASPKLYCILGKRGVISPRKKWFPKYSQGYYPEYHMIINSATKKLSHSSRLEFLDCFTTSEITIIDINK